MSALGELVVTLGLDVGDFIGAIDKADFNTKRLARSMEKDLLGASKASAAALTATGLAALYLGDRALRAAADLDDMAESVGGTVEELSALGDFAKITNADLGLLEGGLTKMARGLVNADEETKGAGKALAALGIDARDATGKLRTTTDLLPEIARELAKYEDGTAKTALAQDLLGKSGAKLLPYLKDLATAGKLVGSVTSEQAAEAEKYTKLLNALLLEKEKLVKTVVLNMVPAVNDLLTVFLNTSRAGGALKGTINELGQSGDLTRMAEDAVLAFGGLIDYTKTTAATIMAIASSVRVVAADVEVLAQLAKVASGQGNLLEFKAVLDNRNKTLDAANQEWAALLNRNTNQTRDAVAEQIRMRKLLAQAESGVFDDARDRQARAGRNRVLNYDPVKEIKFQASEIEAVYSKLMAKSAGFEADFQKTVGVLGLGLATGKLSIEQYTAAYLQLIKQQPVFIEAAKQEAAVLARVSELRNKAAEQQVEEINARDAMLGSLEDGNRLLKIELGALGQTSAERQKALLLLQKEKDIKSALTDEDEQRIEQLYQERFALIDATQAMQDKLGLIGNLRDVGQDAFLGYISGAEDAESVTKRLGKAIETQLLKLLYDLTVGKWTVQLTANIMGVPQSNLGSLLGSSSSAGGLLGDLGSSFLGQQIFGSTAAYNVAGFSGSQAAMLAAQTGEFGAAGLAATSQAGAGASGAFNLAGFAVDPVTLAIAAAVAILASGVFDDGPENIKGQLGFGQGATADDPFGVTALVQGAGTQFTEGLNELFASFAPLDDALADLLSAEQEASALARLQQYNTRASGQDAGIASPEFAFPEGDETAQEQLFLEFLKKKYGDIFEEINTDLAAMIRGFDGTGEELSKFIGGLVRTQQLIGELRDADPLEDVRRQVEEQQDAIGSALRRNQAALRSVTDAFDYSADSVNGLVAAQSQYYLANLDLIAQLSQLGTSIGEMFEATQRSIQLDGLTNEEQYAFLQNESDMLLEQLMSATTIGDIERLSSLLNSNFQSAFGLLDDDEKGNQRQAFLDNIEEVNRIAQERIKEQQDAIAEATKLEFDRLADLLETAAAAQQTAADTQANAADRFAGAVDGFAGLVRDGGSGGAGVEFSESGG